MAAATNPPVKDRAELIRRGQFLAYLTLATCIVEAFVSIGAGLMAGSVALLGFGFDSLIEVTSGGSILWLLYQDADVTRRKKKEATALRIIGWCFLALAAYIGYESLASLVRHEVPSRSIAGICVAVFSLLAMNLLARAKRRVAQGISSAAMRADAKQSDLCSYLSAILLGGLLLNALLGWWWADPIAGLLMVPIIAKEGADVLRGKGCECVDVCQ